MGHPVIFGPTDRLLLLNRLQNTGTLFCKSIQEWNSEPNFLFDPRVDAYIAKSKPFAQPILFEIRELVHKACPGVVETIKWSRPFLRIQGRDLGNMSAFNEHCSWGFWGEEISAVLRDMDLLKPGAMGSLGRLTSVEDLPPKKEMLGLLKQAAAFIDKGEYTSPIAARQKVVKAPAPPAKPRRSSPRRLKRTRRLPRCSLRFSPSCKKEYVEWIADAKRPETRDKRIETAIEWISEGKQRNWKYQNC